MSFLILSLFCPPFVFFLLFLSVPLVRLIFPLVILWYLLYTVKTKSSLCFCVCKNYKRKLKRKCKPQLKNEKKLQQPKNCDKD